MRPKTAGTSPEGGVRNSAMGLCCQIEHDPHTCPYKLTRAPSYPRRSRLGLLHSERLIMSTSGSTPPLSRQPSREEMNASSEDVDTGQTAKQSPPNPTQQKVVDPAPKLSARPRAGTWVAAAASPDAGSTRAPSAANQKSTAPRLVPRGPSAESPKPSSDKVPSTSNLASATLDTPTPSTSTLSAPNPGTAVPSTSKPPTYIKSRVAAQQIPADLADALRAKIGRAHV